MRKPWALAAVSLAVAVGGALFIRPFSSGPRSAALADRETAPMREAEGASPVKLAVGVGANARGRSEASATHARIADRAGAPIPGAEVRWIELPELPGEQLAALPPEAVPWGEIEARTQRVLAREDGSFDPPFERAGEHGAAVWILAGGYFAELITVEPGSQIAAWPELEPAPAAQVRAVDADGQAVPGARVEACVSSRALTASGVPALELCARRCLRLGAELDAEGRAQFPVARWPLIARARRSATARVPAAVSEWSGLTSGEETVLTLLEGFTLVAHLETEDGALPEAGTRIEAWAAQGTSVVAFLGALPIAGLGETAPVVLPAVDAEELRLELGGGNLESVRVEARMPTAGERFEARFVTRAGLELAVAVTGAAGEPLAAARVEAQFGEGNELNLGLTAAATTDERGAALLRGLAPGPARIRVELDGYLAALHELWLPADEGPLAISLQRGARLRGRVTHAGEPVRRFEITSWRPGLEEQISVARCEAEDGGFELAGLAQGELALLATAEGYAPGSPVIVDVPSEGLDDVIVLLPMAATGRGRVVDASTGLPIEGAHVLVCSASGQQLVENLGVFAATDARGEFELAALNPEHVGFGVQSSGYGPYWDLRHNLEGPVLDLGIVALFPVGALRVRLLDAGDLDPTEFVAWAAYADGGAPVALDERGEALLGGVRLGYERVHLRGPDGRQLEQEVLLQDLGGPSEWVADFVWTGRPLVVEVRGAETYAAADLRLQAVQRAGSAHRSYGWTALEAVGDHLEGTLAGMPESGEIGLSVLSGDTPLASTAIRIEATPRPVIDLDRAGGELRVVTEAGTAVAQAHVVMLSADEASAWSLLATTDGEGRVALPVLDVGEVVVNVEHAELGRHHGARFDLREPAEAALLTVVMPEACDLELALRDGLEPLGAVRAQLFHASHPVSVAEAFSNAEGALTFAGLATGEWIVDVDMPRLWPVRRTLRAAPDQGRLEFQVRQRGDLRLDLAYDDGSPLANVAVELVAEEFAEPVATWLAAGLVEAEGLATDSAGRLEVRDLPRGPYRWSLLLPSGALASGAFELAVGDGPPLHASAGPSPHQ